MPNYNGGIDMYKELVDGIIQNIVTGETFPADPGTGNRHSIEYAAWLEAGNEPERGD